MRTREQVKVRKEDKGWLTRRSVASIEVAMFNIYSKHQDNLLGIKDLIKRDLTDPDRKALRVVIYYILTIVGDEE